MYGKIDIKKDYVLIGGTLVMLIISYQLALKKTIEAWNINKRLKQQVDINSGTFQPDYLARQNHDLQQVIVLYKADTVNYRIAMVNQIAEIVEKEHVRIVDVPSQVSFSTNEYLIQKIILKGNYSSLLKAVNSLEQQQSLGYIRSLNLKKPVFIATSLKSNDIICEISFALIK